MLKKIYFSMASSHLIVYNFVLSALAIFLAMSFNTNILIFIAFILTLFIPLSVHINKSWSDMLNVYFYEFNNSKLNGRYGYCDHWTIMSYSNICTFQNWVLKKCINNNEPTSDFLKNLSCAICFNGNIFLYFIVCVVSCVLSYFYLPGIFKYIFYYISIILYIIYCLMWMIYKDRYNICQQYWEIYKNSHLEIFSFYKITDYDDFFVNLCIWNKPNRIVNNYTNIKEKKTDKYKYIEYR